MYRDIDTQTQESPTCVKNIFMHVERRRLGILAYCSMCSPVVDTYKMLIATTKHSGYNKEETMLKIGLSQYCYKFFMCINY